MTTLTCCALALLAAAPLSATAATYRCGNTYQDRPCEGTDAGRTLQGSPRPAGPAASPATPASAHAPGTSRQGAHANVPSSVTDEEGVSVTADKGRATVRNGTLRDVCYMAVEGVRDSLAWVPACGPSNVIAPGASRVLDLRQLSEPVLRVHWWHRGARLPGSNVDGADRVRTLLVRMP